MKSLNDQNNGSTFNVKGQVAIITGSGCGLGFEMAKALKEAGANIVLISRTQSDLDKAAEELSGLPGNALSLKVDVTKRLEVRGAVEKVLNHFGKIDILINNVGTNIRKLFCDFTDIDFDEIFTTNLKSMFICCQEIGKAMIEQKKGVIINVSSVAGKYGIPHLSLYCASKGGVNQLTKALAVELAKDNIRVNAVAPNYFITSLTREWLQDESRLTKAIEKIPMNRIGQLHELKGIILFLASDASSYITGQIIHVDGGFSSGPYSLLNSE